MNSQIDSYFLASLKERFTGSESHPQYQLWLDYALSTNARGAEILRTIHNFIPSVAGMRYLDIGCGFGGACIAFASEGAEVVGIDYDEKLLKIAQENHRDHPDLNISFRNIDVMDWTQVKALGKFDIITSDNVIEHVSDPGRLISYFSQLISANGMVYLTIPNAFSLGQIKKDCHYGLPGISLLDPDDGAIYVKYAINQPFYDVAWYYPYNTFEYLFKRYGLSEKLLNSYEVNPQDIVKLHLEYDQLLLKMQNDDCRGKFPPGIGERIISRLKHHIHKLETDIIYEQTQDDQQLMLLQRNRIFRDYHTELWYFVLRPLPNIERSLSAQLEFSSTSDILSQISGKQMTKLLVKKILNRLKFNK
jgi:SAM-dependent methyltransferase